MRALRWFGAVLIATIAIASASACQVALRAEDEDPRCSPSGKLCAPGRICRGGLCQVCTPKPETCNFEDDDCDGEIDEDFDLDKDGFTVCGEFGKTDCNDDPTKGGADIHPGAPETCNGIDDNCDGRVDEEPNGCGEGKVCLAGKGECVGKGDCRFFGCPMGTSCNVTTGGCESGDCRVNGCKVAGEVCDTSLGRCVKVVAFGDGCDALANCVGAPDVGCVSLVEVGISARSNKICTKACCESTTCPDGFICRMGTSGASVCVRAADVSLVVGSGASFAKCIKNDDCRSGVCENGSCKDGCCGTLECGTGGTCSIRNPGDNRYFCRAGVGTKAVGDNCGSNSECVGGYCAGLSTWSNGRCTKHCCSSTDCPNSWKCQEFTAGGAIVPMCEPIPLSFGTGSLKGGAPCTANNQCRSNVCEDGYCSDFCCVDSDCVPKSYCRPRASGSRYANKCTKAMP
jgi:hypothetical protein